MLVGSLNTSELTSVSNSESSFAYYPDMRFLILYLKFYFIPLAFPLDEIFDILHMYILLVKILNLHK